MGLVTVLSIFIIIGCLALLGYLFYRKSTSCVDNCDTCSNGTCTKCTSGFGIDSNGTPDASGKCPSYKSCVDNCDTCSNGICSKCKGGYAPDSNGNCPQMVAFSLNFDSDNVRGSQLTNIKFDSFDILGKPYNTVTLGTLNKQYDISCPINGYMVFSFSAGEKIVKNIPGKGYTGPLPGPWSSSFDLSNPVFSSSNFSDFVTTIIWPSSIKR